MRKMTRMDLFKDSDWPDDNQINGNIKKDVYDDLTAIIIKPKNIDGRLEAMEKELKKIGNIREIIASSVKSGKKFILQYINIKTNKIICKQTDSSVILSCPLFNYDESKILKNIELSMINDIKKQKKINGK